MSLPHAQVRQNRHYETLLKNTTLQTMKLCHKLADPFRAATPFHLKTWKKLFNISKHSKASINQRVSVTSKILTVGLISHNPKFFCPVFQEIRKDFMTVLHNQKIHSYSEEEYPEPKLKSVGDRDGGNKQCKSPYHCL